ncbi:MAG TPA: substrate-binding domain-containing protein [Tepidisphaeraceae bacterium]|jgi:DNA-binding LacI/PurR family transcriptional regulator
MPRVAIMSDFPNCAASIVFPDTNNFYERAAKYLVSRGRRRVAILMAGPYAEERKLSQIRRHGLQMSEPYLLQIASAEVPEGARHCTQLLMNLPPDKRPDALILDDDNFVEAATAGIAAAGVRCPDDLEIVAHANFPLPPETAVPVKFLGFDCAAILKRCAESIDQQRRGITDHIPHPIPAVFEDEIQGSTPGIGITRSAPSSPGMSRNASSRFRTGAGEASSEC